MDLPAGIDGLDLANFGFFEKPGADLAKFVREGSSRELFKGREVFNLLAGEPEYLDPLKDEAPKAGFKPKLVHVVGAGTMGGDIAAWCAARGLTVTLQDRELRFVEPALARAREFFARRHDSAAAGRLQALRRCVSGPCHAAGCDAAP